MNAWLRRVFAVAGVDYGRVDYGVLDGVPQVWEINLNPTIGRPAGWPQKRAQSPESRVFSTQVVTFPISGSGMPL